jgi:hypothetical protein
MPDTPHDLPMKPRDDITGTSTPIAGYRHAGIVAAVTTARTTCFG